MDDLNFYLVLTDKSPHPCYECEGGTGKDFLLVRANNPAKAALLALGRLAPGVWEDERTLTVHELPMTSKARTEKILGPNDLSRLAVYSQYLRPPAPAGMKGI